ncbi:MAG TPA: protein-L-isoaspartate(D-aspartate) O-methyltransferase [Anaerolineales bacterium]|jgi:protein-L-isoaspartate(D-aspartate) O-methyltransferase
MTSDFDAERRRMIAEQIEGRGLTDARLLAAFEAVPRHLFVPEGKRGLAYADRALPIDSGQTISQPYMVAVMTHLLELNGRERVLEVGTGSGYQTAILAKLAADVHTVEIIPALSESAQKILAPLGIENVHFHVDDGSLGWPPAAPYDGILVTAAAPEVPKPLLAQLSDGGTLVIPVGAKTEQSLEVWKRKGDQFERRIMFDVAFVPLRGKYGRK